MLNKKLMRKWVSEEQAKGSSRAQIFVEVWRKLGYQKIDASTVEKWIQFLQGHRKVAPKFEFNEKHYKLLRAVLEEQQKNKTAVMEWTDIYAKDFAFMDSKCAIGVQTNDGLIRSLSYFDIVNNTQKEMPINFEEGLYHVRELKVDFVERVHVECVDPTLCFIVITMRNQYYYYRRVTAGYVLRLDYENFTASVVNTWFCDRDYFCTIFFPNDRHFFLVLYGDKNGTLFKLKHTTDDWRVRRDALFLDDLCTAYRVTDENKVEYICYEPEEGLLFRDMPVRIGSHRQKEPRTLFRIECEDGFFDQNMRKAPFAWSGQICYLVKHFVGEVDRFEIYRFNIGLVTKRLEKTGINLFGKCFDLMVDENNVLTICVQIKTRFTVHRIQLSHIEPLFNLSLRAVHKYSELYTSEKNKKLLDEMTEKLQTFKFE